MRIGIWNLAGRWSDDHLELMLGAGTVSAATRIEAIHEGKRLSDHDTYVVEVEPAPRSEHAGRRVT
ncbi:MAG TPA: hypothetical protein VFY76_07720 [Nocardioides sp.]|nr:hypothetical protein [Nocardioides sp.]